MNKLIENYGAIGVAIATVVASLITQWAVFGVRLSAVESRQDNQEATLTALQTSLTTQIANYAALSAKIDALTDNVNYIRNRIDSVVK